MRVESVPYKREPRDPPRPFCNVRTRLKTASVDQEVDSQQTNLDHDGLASRTVRNRCR